MQGVNHPKNHKITKKGKMNVQAHKGEEDAGSPPPPPPPPSLAAMVLVLLDPFPSHAIRASRIPMRLNLVLIFLLSLLAPAIPHDTLKFELIHRHQLIPDSTTPFLSMPKLTQLERVRDLYYRDIARHHAISHRLFHQTQTQTQIRRNTLEKIRLRMNSGADYGNGVYLVHLKVGTPPQKFTLVADTGSELTWMNCRYRCQSNCTATRKGRLNNRRVFFANRSSSFKTLPCISRMCKIDLMNLFSLARCPSPLDPCAYDYSYLDGSTALGIFANETITVELTNGRKTKLRDTVIGCTESAKGNSFKGADGVLGLGYGNHSFTEKASENAGGRFSYCLVDHLSHKNVSNYLTFGGSRKRTSNMQYTKLEVGGVISPFYGVNIIGISVGGSMLKVPITVWDINAGGGTILDTGTSLTLLTMLVYKPLMAELVKPLSKFQRLSLSPFEFCFNSTGFDEDVLPIFRFHFEDGAQLEPPVKSYIIDTAPQTKCLGFIPLGSPGVSIIGNIMQQNHVWEFDFVRRTVGFASSSCI